MSVEARGKVTQILGDGLCSDVGSIILDYIVSTSLSKLVCCFGHCELPSRHIPNRMIAVTMPEFNGSTDELFELFYSFLVGVIEEEKLRDACGRLMDAFGKGLEVCLCMRVSLHVLPLLSQYLVEEFQIRLLSAFPVSL